MKTATQPHPKAAPETMPAYGMTDDARFIMKDLSDTMLLMSLALDTQGVTADIEPSMVAATLRTFQRITDQCIAGAPFGILHVNIN